MGSHGEGEWWTPGGHLELWETPEDCAKREVLEETGIVLDDVILGPYTNDFFRESGKHYITLFIIAECPEGIEPRNMEPEKCL
jgi:8-oxo-dGTP diphosphatase